MDYSNLRLQWEPDPNANPHRLDALPEHRQRILLWRLATNYSPAQADRHMPAWTGRACRVPSYSHPVYEAAVLGDDGLYHLWHHREGMKCVTPHSPNPSGPWLHKGTFHWKDTNGRHKRRTYRRHVRRQGAPVEPSLVPTYQRCWLLNLEEHHRGLNPAWPRWIDTTTYWGKIRWSFVERFGRGCAVCGGPGVGVIDHDPFSGIVRGMLCNDCNSWIDLCPHVVGCQWAEYLNHPPAAPLNLPYPKLGEKSRYTWILRRAQATAWDPMLFADVRVRCERAALRAPQRDTLW